MVMWKSEVGQKGFTSFYLFNCFNQFINLNWRVHCINYMFIVMPQHNSQISICSLTRPLLKSGLADVFWIIFDSVSAYRSVWVWRRIIPIRPSDCHHVWLGIWSDLYETLSVHHQLQQDAAVQNVIVSSVKCFCQMSEATFTLQPESDFIVHRPNTCDFIF